VTNLRRAADRIKEKGADLVAVEVDAPGDPTLRTIEKIDKEQGLDVGIVVISQDPSQELLVACMRAGCDEFLEFPIDREELGEALARLYRKKGIVDETSGQVTAVYSAKGGTGNTTIACNLATMIARELGGESDSCVLDLNLQFGDVALMLDIREFAHSITETCYDADRLDAALLRDYVTRHDSGAALLPAPVDLEEAGEIDPSDLISVVHQCQSVFKHVILDLPHTLDTLSMAGLDAADEIYLICDMCLPTIHDTREAAELLGEFDYKKSEIKLIINRYYDSDEISLEEICEHLQLPAYWLVPYDSPVAIASVNSGRTFDEVDRNSEAARSLLALSQALAGVEISPPRKKRFSFFGR
jgi:pilus assembly protein CpaE